MTDSPVTTDEIIAAIKAKKLQINPLRAERLTVKARLLTIDGLLGTLSDEVEALFHDLNVATDV